jgi:PAS domain S-box-containing protein
MKETAPESSEVAEVVADLDLHQHLCLIYDTQEEQLAAALPYLRAGLERGEKCLYVADENTAASVLEALRRAGTDFERYQRDGWLTIMGKDEAYLKRGRFDPDLMIRFWADAVREARTAKFAGLRTLVTAEMTWALGGSESADQLIEYESKLNHFVRDHNVVIVCQYNRARFSPEVILDVLRTHPLVIYGGLVAKNPYYVPPEEFLKPNHPALEVDRLLKNIVEWQRAEERLRETQADFAAAQRLAKLGTWRFDIAANRVTWSEGLYRIFDMDRGGFGGTYESFLGHVHPDDRPRVLEMNSKARASGEPFEFDYRIVTQTGELKNIREIGYAVKDGRGTVVGLFGAAQDVTQRKRAECGVSGGIAEDQSRWQLGVEHSHEGDHILVRRELSDFWLRSQARDLDPSEGARTDSPRRPACVRAGNGKGQRAKRL